MYYKNRKDNGRFISTGGTSRIPNGRVYFFNTRGDADKFAESYKNAIVLEKYGSFAVEAKQE